MYSTFTLQQTHPGRIHRLESIDLHHLGEKHAVNSHDRNIDHGWTFIASAGITRKSAQPDKCSFNFFDSHKPAAIDMFKLAAFCFFYGDILKFL
jgi:hypothetical protein